jgi:hypothetical protein
MLKHQLVGLLLFLSFFGYSQNKNFIDQPYLETSASADTLVTPDRIYLSIRLLEEDSKGKISVEELENKMAEQLTSLGVDLGTQLRLSDLSSELESYFLKKKEVLKEKNFTLLVYDAESAGKVIQALEKIGISNIRLAQTEYSEIESMRLTMKMQAIQKAKRIGEMLLAGLDQELGPALYISDSSPVAYATYNSIPTNYSNSPRQGLEEYDPLAVSFRKIKITGQVNVKFKILP